MAATETQSKEYNGCGGNLVLSSGKAKAGDKDHTDCSRSTPTTPVVWDTAVCKKLQVPYTYRKVAALIVHWADYLDTQLPCGDEIRDLQDVFTNQYHFKTKTLILDDKINPQLKLRSGIDQFVLENEGPHHSNLLIVYYTGHGRDSGADGLTIIGERQMGYSDFLALFNASANWKRAEESLVNEAHADVLTILDCCCAGSIMKGKPAEDARTYEVLAATPRKKATEAPGPLSFTRALIDVLKASAEKPD
ncbi:hypothetical protein BAUCODRAFT_118540 [Baudoinia panamericana UAMH 10762]|uniref:Peptidase C14 caspase domain-containing protein n=1 Tax=Baudoinia panamericana (strain UAMH 10762) TaxID=717646 RepID=M2MV32_BAUPA|nr:uncharacterized protein BAUCODRAFT_118540 [Baudoinia panamericana UAMH 10762]EMD00812.1 hypothetical protein BAUCODRAFT_118540 [Baudoinia panamericana UAMH 10762]